MIHSLNDSNLEDVLTKNNKVIIKFYADWCGICKAFSPEFKRMVQEQEEQSSDITFFEVNAPDNPKTRLLAGVYSLPFFASFENGKLVNKVASADKKVISNLFSELNSSKPVLN